MTTSVHGVSAVWAFAEHEHRDLARGINQIHDVAEEVARLPTPGLSPRVLDILRWLDGILGPHMAWEDGWLFPEIDAHAGDPDVTRAARDEHRQIRMITARLRDDYERLDRHVEAEDRADTRSDLLRLERLIRTHLQREERSLLPLVEDRRPLSRATETRRRRAPDRHPVRPA